MENNKMDNQQVITCENSNKDGNKTNNKVENLEWVTNAENAEHKKHHNLGKTLKAKIAATGSNNSQAKLNEQQILEIRDSTLSSSELSKKYNVSRATINDIVAYRTWNNV